MEVNTSNISIKDLIVRDIARNNNVINDKIVSQEVINAVVTHQFESVANALPLHNSVEISGFGTFRYSVTRAAKKLVQYENLLIKYTNRLNEPDVSEHERRNLQMRIVTTIGNIKSIKPKIQNENSTDI